MLSEHRRPMDAATMAMVLLGSGFIGFLFAPLGLGGGLLFAPLLHYGLGWEIDGALLIVSLGLSATVSWGSGLRHRKEGHVSDVRFKQSLVGALPGAILGVVIVASLSGSFDVFFKTLSLGFVTWAIIKTLRAKNQTTQNREPTMLPLRFGVASGGLLSSVLAIGAGAIYVPVLRTYGGLESRKAIGTSLHIMMVILPISILTHFVALDQSQVDVLASNLLLILSLPIVVIVAANLGARFGIAKVSEQHIMQLFVAVLLFIGIRYVLDLSSEFL
ncbi:MAG: hypothetical protein CMA60_03485 [Euryarchaeota archaeon]|nr:hypothetical protein [Euryarchaeota archaeon]